MNIPTTGKLVTVDLREVWPHEARSFTPWLAENLDEISELIGVPLELEEIEKSVATFSADLLARIATTDQLVVIENQLEKTNHTHLGQILTYASGLDAKVVVWIAKEFDPAHRSAIDWLNDISSEDISFFGIRVSAARINDSLPAPRFDIVCQPNEWERRMHQIVQPPSDLATKRIEFWQHLINRHPEEANYGPPNGLGYRWHPFEDLDLVIVLFLAVNRVGIFVRPMRGESAEELYERFKIHEDKLKQHFQSIEPNKLDHFLGKSLRLDTDDRSRWDEMTDWLFQQSQRYEAILRDVLADKD